MNCVEIPFTSSSRYPWMSSARVIQSALASRPLKQWWGGCPVDGGEFVAEAELGAGDVGIVHGHASGHACPTDTGEVAGIFRETPPVRLAVSIHILIFLVIAAIAMVIHHIDVDIEAVGPEDRHATLKLLAGAVTGGYRPFLVLGPKVVIVEGVITDGEGSARRLPDRGEPDGREPGFAQRFGLLGDVVPPEVPIRISGGRRGDIDKITLEQDARRRTPRAAGEQSRREC